MTKFLSTQFLRPQAPIEDDPLVDFHSLFEQQFPPECKAQRAVEGHDRHPRDKDLVPSERFGE